MHPKWAADHFMREKFELPQLKDYVKEGPKRIATQSELRFCC